MRLYLSSYRLGDRAGALLALIGGTGARAAIISNALDGIPSETREAYRAEVYDSARELASLGIVGEDLDLRRFFARKEALRQELAGYDLVWVMGGNAFTLRRAMKQSGFDAVISGMLDRDEIVYGGFSGGCRQSLDLKSWRSRVTPVTTIRCAGWDHHSQSFHYRSLTPAAARASVIPAPAAVQGGPMGCDRLWGRGPARGPAAGGRPAQGRTAPTKVLRQGQPRSGQKLGRQAARAQAAVAKPKPVTRRHRRQNGRHQVGGWVVPREAGAGQVASQPRRARCSAGAAVRRGAASSAPSPTAKAQPRVKTGDRRAGCRVGRSSKLPGNSVAGRQGQESSPTEGTRTEEAP